MKFVGFDDGFRTFGRDADGALPGMNVEGFVDLFAVEEIDKSVAAGDDFELVPFSGGGVEVFRKTDAGFFLPVFLAFFPVDASRRR